MTRRTISSVAGTTAHETKHVLQRLTPQTYHRGHEFEAFWWGRQADPTHAVRSTQQIWDHVNRSYQGVRAAPAGWTPF